MKRQPILVAGVEFKSAAALTRHARSIVERYADGEMMNEPDFRFMADLIIRRHDTPDEKFVPGRIDEVCGIRVRHESGMPRLGKSATNRNHCYVVYDNGDEIDFSWKKCCEGSFSPAKDADHAMRRAAESHVRAYKRMRFMPVGGNPVCDATGEPLTREGCQVDHWPVTWTAVRDRFLAAEGIRLEEVRTVSVPEGGCVMEDAGLMERFQKHHQATATLRLVTTEVNRRSWRDEEAIRS